ncbi:AAA family ATPase [Streptomyces argenteolus]|uniref:ATP-binding protein n=1 Tax=Streptomyces sp. NPDC025273 TaxID=3155251 RepID=UPI0034064F3A
MTFQQLDTTIPDRAVIVLIGAAGSGKSTLASTWHPTEVLSLDHYRALISDSAGDQEATGDAVAALHLVLEARLRRGLTSVIDATNTDTAVRARTLQAAGRYGMPTVALLVTTPLPVALERNAARPDDRRVPENILRAQHAAAFAARPQLQEEGFGQVILASDIDRLGPLLQRLSTNRHLEEAGRYKAGRLDDAPLRRFLGPELARLAVREESSALANGDQVLTIRMGKNRLTFALRNSDRMGDTRLDVLLPCLSNQGYGECPGPVWAPVYDARDIYPAYTGALGHNSELVCSLCGFRVADQETADHAAGSDDPKGEADLYAQYWEAVSP